MGYIIPILVYCGEEGSFIMASGRIAYTMLSMAELQCSKAVRSGHWAESMIQT